MSITIRQVVDAYRLVKAAQETEKRHPAPPRRKRRAQPEPFPDYGKSLVTQMETDPTLAGLRRAGYTTPLGAVLGGLIGYLLRQDRQGTAVGAGAGALAGGIPGFLSGSREAESEKTRLLALRRLGVNTPGELSAIENFPESFERLTQEEPLRKQSASALASLLKPSIAKSLAAGAVGIPAGAAFGRYVTPKLFGYEGDQATTNMSMLIDAGLFAALLGMPFHPRTADLLTRLGPRVFPIAASAAGTSELIPVAMNTLRQATGKKTTYDKLVDTLQTPTAKGLGVGAAGAGLAGLTSGLLRAPTEGERESGAGRTQMAAKDMLKFLIPALIAGGVGGKLIGQQQPPGSRPPSAL